MEQFHATPMRLGEFLALQGGTIIGEAVEAQTKANSALSLVKDIVLVATNIGLATYGRQKLTGTAQDVAGYVSYISAGMLTPSVSERGHKMMGGQ